MKISIAQQNYHIGNFERNTNKIIEAIAFAKAEMADLVLFSELAICGYPPRDFLEFNDFVERCENAIQLLVEHTEGIAIVVGGPSKNPKLEGKDLTNYAWFLADKKIVKVVHKTLLPTYDVFDE